jgi:hypothetical protein
MDPYSIDLDPVVQRSVLFTRNLFGSYRGPMILSE